MQYRVLGRTGLSVSTISFGAWAIGGSWGAVDDEESMRTLHAAIDSGVNFIDTADVYGDGRSERLVARLRRERPGETIHVATKAGRRLARPDAGGLQPRQSRRLGRPQPAESRDRTPSISCSSIARRPRSSRDEGVYGLLDDLVSAGKIRHYGVSVERVDEALDAIRHPGVKTVQIIFNMFRLKPADAFFPEAVTRQVGVLARVPLASGLLTGKLTAASRFADDDHRTFNREGEAFDKGETFSGVPYDVGLAAVEDLRALVTPGVTLAQLALRWTLMFDAVTCAIPGARTPEQARSNAAAADLPALDRKTMEAVRRIYDNRIKPHVHANW